MAMAAGALIPCLPGRMGVHLAPPPTLTHKPWASHTHAQPPSHAPGGPAKAHRRRAELAMDGAPYGSGVTPHLPYQWCNTPIVSNSNPYSDPLVNDHHC